MNTQDKWIGAGIAIVILIHLAIWLTGYFTNKLSYLISFVNFAFAATVLVYWLINELRMQQHYIESREIIVLIFEMIVAVSALANIVSFAHYKALRILQYIFFGIDVMVLIAAIIFMLTFKLTKLF